MSLQLLRRWGLPFAPGAMAWASVGKGTISAVKAALVLASITGGGFEPDAIAELVGAVRAVCRRLWHLEPPRLTAGNAPLGCNARGDGGVGALASGFAPRGLGG